MKTFGYIALGIAVLANLIGWAHSGNEWCGFVAGAVAGFGVCVWQREGK